MLKCKQHFLKMCNANESKKVNLRVLTWRKRNHLPVATFGFRDLDHMSPNRDAELQEKAQINLLLKGEKQ